MNPTEHTLTIEGLRLVVPPGATVEIPDEHCQPRRARNGNRIPSVIESLAPQLTPESKEAEEVFSGTPDKEAELPAPPPPSAAALEAAGHAPGVAAILAEQAATPEEDPAQSLPKGRTRKR